MFPRPHKIADGQRIYFTISQQTTLIHKNVPLYCRLHIIFVFLGEFLSFLFQWNDYSTVCLRSVDDVISEAYSDFRTLINFVSVCTLVTVWKDLEQHVIDSTIDQWQCQLTTSVRNADILNSTCEKQLNLRTDSFLLLSD